MLQVVRVANPLQTSRGLVHLRHYMQNEHADHDGTFTYIFPHDDYVVLGTTTADSKLNPSLI
jgi:hypothetical protein